MHGKFRCGIFFFKLEVSRTPPQRLCMVIANASPELRGRWVWLSSPGVLLLWESHTHAYELLTRRCVLRKEGTLGRGLVSRTDQSRREGVDAANWWEDSTLAAWGSGAWAGRDRENRESLRTWPFWEYPWHLCSVHSLSSVVLVTGWPCPPLWALIIRSGVHCSYSSLGEDFLPLDSVLLLLLHLSSEL